MPNDPYVYPGSDPAVLINRYGERDYDRLAKLELAVVRRGIEIVLNLAPHPSAPDERVLRETHVILFGKLYLWAGKTRTVNIHKTAPVFADFCRAQHIDGELKRRFAILAEEKYLKGKTSGFFAERAAAHICEINAIHPFREGNGRTMMLFLVRLARHAGHDVDLERLQKDRWLSASIAGHAGDYGLMQQVIADILIPHSL